MVRSISLFGQLLSELSRRDFETLVSRHGAERYAKGFSSWMVSLRQACMKEARQSG